MVKDGTIPALEDRVPPADQRLIEDVVDEIGVYGGTWRRADNYYYHMGIVNRSDCILEDYDAFTYAPYTCSDFEITEGGRKFVFTLREGHKWSDGEPFTVADVAFAWEDLNYMTAVPGPHPEQYKGWAPSSYRDPVTGNDPTFTVEDDVTFSVGFDSPHFQFLVALAHTRGSRCRYKCFTSPKHYASQFHPKYADPTELTKLIKDGEHKDWTDLFLTRNEMYLGYQSALPWIGPYVNIGGSGLTDNFADYEPNPFFIGFDPMGNQLPYTYGMYLTKHDSHEVAVFRAMAGEHDAGVHGFSVLELPMYQDNMVKGDYSLYSWAGRGRDGVMTFNMTYNEDPEIGYWMRTRDFRRALSYVIDRDALNQILHLGLATTHSLAPSVGQSPWAPGGDTATAYTTYDIDTANSMLDALKLVDTDGDGLRNRTGVLGGDTGNLEFYAEIPTNDPSATKAQLIKEGLAEVGIGFDFKVNANYYQDIRANTAYFDVGAGSNHNPWTGTIVTKSGGHQAPAIGKWFETQGECDYPDCQGPTGGVADVLPMAPSHTWPADSDGIYHQLWELEKEGQQYPNEHPENIRIGKEMWVINIDQQYMGGALCCSPNGGIQLNRNNLRNVPKQSVQYYNGNYTELYYFEDGIDNKNNPGNKSKKYKSESFMTGLTY